MDFNNPTGGWINAIRTALKMSLGRLGNRLGITAPAVKQMEVREQSGCISINVLQKVGHALNMKFVYGFIPQSGTLNQMIKEKAREIAKEIVLRASNTMQLEGQENTEDRIEKAIQEKTEEIIRKMPRYLWD